MKTNFGINSPQAVNRWSNFLAMQVKQNSYFSKWEGRDQSNIIQELVDLEEAPGDEVRFDLLLEIRGDMVEGDDPVEGKEYPVQYAQDRVRIDQARMGADMGGRMTRKRTLHNIREAAKGTAQRFASAWMDELKIVYLSGAQPGAYSNPDAMIKRSFAGNPIEAPDPAHMAYGGSAVSKATLAESHKMSRDLVERLAVMPETLASNDPDGKVCGMQPVDVEGSRHFVLLMSPYQHHDLRTEKNNELSWAEVEKAAATALGKNSPLFKGASGMINDVVIHKHKNVRRFSNYGAGQNVEAHRALLMGAQAGILAYGVSGGTGKNGRRFSWHEKERDYGNSIGIAVGTIVGFKKTRFNGADFGVVSVDTAAKSPNPPIV